MLFRALVLSAIAFAALLAGCSQKSQYRAQFVAQAATGVTNDVAFARGPENQTELKVKTAAAGSADLSLVEAQGYYEARDRFFQMDVLRRVGRGTLAEILGAAALPKDIAVAAVGLREGIKRKKEALWKGHPDAYRMLEAFAVGVNRFVAESAQTHAPLLNQYRQLTHSDKYQLQPWEPEDSIAVAQNIAFYLSSSLQEKLGMGTLGFGLVAAASTGGQIDKLKVLELPALLDQTLDLRPLYNTFILDAKKTAGGSHPLRLPSTSAIATAFRPACHEYGFPFRECHRLPGFGSNNFVVSKDFAGGDAAFVANDPHLPLGFPMTFYELSLDATAAGGKLHARGVNIPGVPGVLIGHNEEIAWALTNLTADVDDVYLDVVSEDGKGTTLDDETVPMTTVQESFAIRGADGSLAQQTVSLRFVPHHGPVISDYIKELDQPLKTISDALGSQVVATYKWTGHAGTAEVAAVLGLNLAKNVNEVRQALKNFGTGAQNVIYADRQGNIGYYAHGDFPVRHYVGTELGKWSPLLPTPGMGSFEWEKQYRTDIPEMANPVSGKIVTANNDPYGETAKGSLANITDYFGYGFADGARATRISQRLDELRAQAPLDFSAVGKVQYDHVDLGMQARISLLKKANLTGANLSASAQALRDKLVAWNGDFDRATSEPVAAHAWAEALADAFVDITAPAPIRPAMKAASHTGFFLKTLYHKLNDDLALPQPVAAVKVLAQSLEAAAQALIKPELAGKRWGDIHTLSFTNQLEGLLPAPKLPALPRSGYFETVDVAGPGFGPNFRLVMSVKAGAPIEAKISVPGGNYGADALPAWQVETERYLNGELRSLVPFL